MTRRDRTPAPLADSGLLAVGLRPGDRVRFRRAEGGTWREATVERRERDGSIGVRDDRGALRALPLERLEVRGVGPRGGTVWEPVADRAARDEQLGLL
jgi:hypothetical protein